jgi:RNA recognition motif-containing protein
MDGRFFEGRPLSVQPARTPPASDRVFDARNQPTDTLFIGNLSFDVSDSDLHSLFASVENVVDVRVAIDRGTGQPRGFAHAEFKDVESAVKAQETLNGFLLHGRRLRVDYSSTRHRRHSNQDAGGRVSDDAAAAAAAAAAGMSESSAAPRSTGTPIDVAA